MADEGIQSLVERGLYNICFRNAGVGFMFYVGEYDEKGRPTGERKMRISRYYPTFSEALKAELEASHG